MMYNPFSLEGKTILVTGASSGIGKATAIECSKMGAKLVITGRNKERLQSTFDLLSGLSHQQVAADLTNNEELENLVESCPNLDGALFCAGITDTTPIKFITDKKLRQIFDINLFAPTLITKYLVAKKKINKGASLVYISSMGAIETTPGLGIYAASKGGLNSMVRTIATELSYRKIRANSIMPMMVKTELVENITLISVEELAEDEKKYPLGYGKPTDIAYAAIFLLSDASGWITGTELKMDGGSTLL